MKTERKYLEETETERKNRSLLDSLSRIPALLSSCLEIVGDRKADPNRIRQEKTWTFLTNMMQLDSGGEKKIKIHEISNLRFES
jgi:glucosamine 6-phosphate synthetase-like amidotransferase/phosphosugar isomerase protein